MQWGERYRRLGMIIQKGGRKYLKINYFQDIYKI